MIEQKTLRSQNAASRAQSSQAPTMHKPTHAFLKNSATDDDADLRLSCTRRDSHRDKKVAGEEISK
jgi:hypothetical protein